jgi:hypothetical protein
MAGKPKTKDFSAWEDRQPMGGNNPTLHIAGRGRISSTHQKPKLTETVPPGINPAILLMDLTIETSGAGIEPTDPWAPVKFEKPASKGQVTEVDIRWEGQSIEKCTVKIVV